MAEKSYVEKTYLNLFHFSYSLGISPFFGHCCDGESNKTIIMKKDMKKMKDIFLMSLSDLCYIRLNFRQKVKCQRKSLNFIETKRKK